MRKKTALFSVFLLLMHPFGADASPSRVISLNLCTDQWLMELGASEQIMGISFNAANAKISAGVKTARHYKQFHADAESLLSARPDLILMGAVENTPLQHLLEQQEIPVYRLRDITSVTSLQTEIMNLGKILGQPDNAQLFITRINQALSVTPKQPKRAILYYTRGYTENTHGLMADILKKSGITLLQPPHGKGAFKLEEVLDQQPDILILPHYAFAVTSEAESMLHHPALANIKTVQLPGNWLTCPDASILQIIEALSHA